MRGEVSAQPTSGFVVKPDVARAIAHGFMGTYVSTLIGKDVRDRPIDEIMNIGNAWLQAQINTLETRREEMGQPDAR